MVQEAFSRAREYQLLDSSGYLFERIDAMAQPDYLPSDQDMLRARVKTTGIQVRRARALAMKWRTSR
eukprot:TRINITY_DN12534_c0_g1_i1.p1 TRINITY_DN12534_c0_g1~~TRINITY_DN12534_c0_g1_i1.p1  ORF type:complete len:67 (+),score=0.22 TRINITY_DN12534_c0_g1_i1:52-252(+)